MTIEMKHIERFNCFMGAVNFLKDRNIEIGNRDVWTLGEQIPEEYKQEGKYYLCKSTAGYVAKNARSSYYSLMCYNQELNYFEPVQTEYNGKHINGNVLVIKGVRYG